MKEKKLSPIKRLREIRGMSSALTAFGAMILIYVVFGLVDANVFSKGNILNLLRSMSKYLLVGVGQSFLLITGNIDLSIGALVGMSSMLAATLMVSGMPIFVALLITLLACLAIGLINGLLVGRYKLPPFIATLGTMFTARGIAYIVNNNRNTVSISTGIGKESAESFRNFFYYGKTLGLYNSFWIAILIFSVFFFVLSKTRTGRHIYAVGSNSEAAKNSGINVLSTITKAYLVSAFCAYVTGIILCAQSGMGNMEAGNMYEMYGVAAGVIGGVSPLGGTGLLLGTLAGSAVWQTLENGLNLVGATVGIQRIVVGIIVVQAVVLDIVFRKKAKERINLFGKEIGSKK